MLVHKLDGKEIRETDLQFTSHELTTRMQSPLHGCACTHESTRNTRTAGVWRYWISESIYVMAFRFSSPASFSNTQTKPTARARLQPRATDPVILSADVAASDLLQRRAAAQRHGNLELVPQHLQCLPHTGLAVHGEGEQDGPSNLTEDKHDALHLKIVSSFFSQTISVIQQGTYKYSWGSQCQGLEHVSAMADATVKEHRDTPFGFSDNLKFSSPL